MEEEIEMEIEDERIQVYDVVEIDFDYEFDASRFFDFSRLESKAEALFSESWFNSAPDYPPSPFIAQLFPLNGLSSPHVSPKSNYADRLSMDDDDADIAQHNEYCDQYETYKEYNHQGLLKKPYEGSFTECQIQPENFQRGPSRGLTFFDHLAHDTKKTKISSHAKPSMQKRSTLMKPTASQLAKQCQQRQLCDSRLQKNEGTGAHSGIESQASKRQKLDGGQLRRIVDMKQPVNLIHKLPKKDPAAQGLSSKTKLRITIPREPDLATAHRAERLRSTNTKEMENSTATRCRFKARPFNRKNSEAPTVPLPRRTTQHLPEHKASNLETPGKIKQQIFSASSKSSICQTDKGLNKLNAHSTVETASKDGKMSHSDAPKVAVRQVVHSFKARPLDRKILTSRGDIGVFRNSKRDVTVPKEFEFQKSKRTQHNLPTELFSKLSLAGEPQSKNCVQAELPQRTSIPAKGSKENRWESCHQSHQNMTHQAKEKQDNHSVKEGLAVATGGTISRNGVSRPFGSWRQ